jgi:outer membrane protein OmpA-like peptidoglycan-associated protein
MNIRASMTAIAASVLLVSCGGGGGGGGGAGAGAGGGGGGGGNSTGPAPVQKSGALAFVACPEFRDLQVDAVLANSCWVTTYKGEKISLRGAIGPAPQLGHAVLVEAVDAGGTDSSCGGRVLAQTRISVLPEINSACQTVLAPEGVTLPPATPSQVPMANLDPPQPYKSSSFALFFGHQSWNIDTLGGEMHVPVEIAANLAMRGNAKAVVVTGHAASTILSDGTVSPETPQLAQQRAERVAKALRILGVPAAIIQASGTPVVPAADGENAFKSRSVTIDVQI